MNFKSVKNLGLTLFIFATTFFASATTRADEVAPFYSEELMLTQNTKEMLLASAQGASVARRGVILKAVSELEAWENGERDRTSYGASPIGISYLFDWWCSEFSKTILTQSGAFASSPKKRQKISEVTLTEKLMEFFSENNSGKDVYQMGENIQAGDYLALTVPYENSPDHSTIVVFVDPEKRFILTIDGNDSLNDKVALHKREYLRPHAHGKYINPSFLFLGKVDQVSRAEI